MHSSEHVIMWKMDMNPLGGAKSHSPVAQPTKQVFYTQCLVHSYCCFHCCPKSLTTYGRMHPERITKGSFIGIMPIRDSPISPHAPTGRETYPLFSHSSLRKHKGFSCSKLPHRHFHLTIPLEAAQQGSPSFP